MQPVDLKKLDQTLGLSSSRNVEIQLNWFLLSIKHCYTEVYALIERFLGSHGRMKYNRPIYQYYENT